MAEPLTIEPRRTFQTFMDFPLVRDLNALDAHVAVMGIPYGDPYTSCAISPTLAASR